MQIVIDIPDEQVKKSLEESKYINEDEGEKGFVNIAMLYTNARLEFVDVERKTDFYSCKYKILPKGHGKLLDADKLKHAFIKWSMVVRGFFTDSDIASIVYNSPTIIEADKESEGKK